MAGPRWRKRLRRSAVLALLLTLVGGGVYVAVEHLLDTESLIRERCTAVVGSVDYELKPDQAANAALISAIAVQRGLPPRAASIALATAIQESKLRNIAYGDRDSLGLFQQRPSQDWGTREQILDPVYATNAFYDELIQISGYEQLAVTDAAQQVQRSAFPDAYADHEDEGRAFASALTGQSLGALNCTLRQPRSPGDAETVAAELTMAFGDVPARTDAAAVQIEAADPAGWAMAHWAVAQAKNLQITSVSFAGLHWNRSEGGWSVAETVAGQVRITVAGPDAAAAG